MKLSKNKILLACLLGSAITTTSMGIELEEIRVSTTGLGQEESIEDVHASVEIIDSKVIQQTSARSIPQVLNEALGIDVRDGGSSSTISIRGFSDNHTLILVDGLRVSGKYGSTDLTSISLENVEKVEIIKGPMSALYGADALAGVVNIITKKKAAKDYVKASILGGRAQNGERGTGIVRLSAAKVADNITHNIALEAREKSDYRLDSSSVATDLREESRKFISYSNVINLGSNDTLSSKLEYARQDDAGVYDSRGTAIPTYEIENRYHAALQHNHTAESYLLDTNVGYSYSDTKVDRASGLETTDYKQLEINSYFRHFTTDKMTNIIGVGYRNEDIDVSTNTQKASRDNYNVLFQNDYEITKNLTSSLGLRYDDFSDFGDSLNPKASLMYKYNDFKFRTSYGEAFRAPSFTEMYIHITRGGGRSDISGNANLKPEESKTHEFSVSYSKNNFALDVTHHRTKLDNLIAYSVDRSVGAVTYGSYKNVSKASINGTEVSLSYKAQNGLGVKVGWENLETEDETTGSRLTGSANTSFKANLSYTLNDFDMYLNIKKYNDFYESDGGRPSTNVNSDYTVADAKVNYNFSDNIEFFIGVDNIQNKIMPYNMTLRGTPNDPGERYYYTGINFSL